MIGKKNLMWSESNDSDNSSELIISIVDYSNKYEFLNLQLKCFKEFWV